MGVWGSGPAENDDAFDVFGDVRWVLDDAWALLRGDDRTLDASELELIDAVSGIVNALGEAGIRLQPDDADELSERWHDQLSDEAWDALTAEFPRTRPPFEHEGEAERWLRQAGAKYQVWMWAAQFGDDQAAAWRASKPAECVFAIARAAGVSDADICRAFARCILEHFGPQTDEPYVSAVRILDKVIAGRPVDAATIAAIPPTDPRSFLVAAAKELGADKQSLVLGGVFRYERVIPQLGTLLHRYLDPLVEPRLG